MESSNFASGDFNNTPVIPRSSLSPRTPRSPRNAQGEDLDENRAFKESEGSFEEASEPDDLKDCHEGITAEAVGEQESKLKERIAQCRNIIESLKLELSEEKARSSREAKLKNSQATPEAFTPSPYTSFDVSTSDKFGTAGADMSFSSNMYSTCVENKLSCDLHLMEYEKQLQQYQNTLNMAQIEKKNAIRKQMLAKAFRLKLLEVENQCNIELLRVKQSMQCLEPLQMIANNWKNDNEDLYNPSKFHLTVPQYPELAGLASSTRSDVNSDPTPDGDRTNDQNTTFSSETYE